VRVVWQLREALALRNISELGYKYEKTIINIGHLGHTL